MVFSFVRKKIIFRNCTFLKESFFNGLNNEKNFNIPLDNFHIVENGTFVILEQLDSKVELIRIGKNIKVEELSIFFREVDKIRINECTVNFLSISGAKMLNNSWVTSINIYTSNCPSIVLNNFSFERINFNDTTPIDLLKFNKISIINKTTLKLLVVNIKRLQIIDVIAENIEIYFLKANIISLIEIQTLSTKLKILHYIEPDEIGIRKERPMKITKLRLWGNIFFEF